MKMKKLLYMISLVALMLVVAACSSNSSSDTNSDTSTGNNTGGSSSTTNEATGSDEIVTLRLSGWMSSESETRVILDQIKAFEELYPNIKISYEPIGDYADQIQLMIASKDEPDVFYMDVNIAQDIIREGVLEDLTPFIEADGVDTSDFYPALLNPFTSDGKIYGLPKGYSTLALVYDKDALEEAGVSAPTTWGELEQVAKALTTNDRVGLALAPGADRIFAFTLQNGHKLIYEDGSVRIDLPEVKEAFNFYYGLKTVHGAAETFSNLGDGWTGESFKNQHAAMVVEGPWMVGYLADEAPHINWGVAELPVGKQKGTLAFTVAYVMGKNSQHKEEAFKLLQFLTGPEGQKITADGGLEIPSRQSLSDYFVDNYPERAAWVRGAEYGTAWTLGQNHARKQDAFTNIGFEGVILGGQSVDQAFEAAQRELDRFNR